MCQSRHLQISQITSEDLWTRTVDEAQVWYKQYLKLDPLARLTAKPKASEELTQMKWARVSRRIETMIVSAAPQAIKDELNASRTSGNCFRCSAAYS